MIETNFGEIKSDYEPSRNDPCYDTCDDTSSGGDDVLHAVRVNLDGDELINSYL